MSLRIIVKSDTIATWISDRQGLPARKCGTDTDLRILFDGPVADCESLSHDEFVAALKQGQQALLVDDQPGKTFHQFVARG